MPYVPHPTCQVTGLGKLLEDTLGYRTDGTFVEVGAFDGQTYSNTSFLADLGWRGVYVEAVPHFAFICAARHTANHNVSVVQCAVGATTEMITLQLGGALTTSDPTLAAAYAQIDWAQGALQGDTIEVQQRRLEDILAETGVPRGFDLLTVDVEGVEDSVFASFDLAAWRPKMLIVELEDEHPSLQPFPAITARARNLRARITGAGYSTLYRDAVNTVFLAD